MATQEQQHAGLRYTYKEHASHVRHRAHVPIADGLVEGEGTLQRSEGRAAVWSERRSRSEGMRDGWRRRHGDARAAATRRWRNTYSEHDSHVRHRAHVPVTDGLIEGLGTLQRSEGRAAVWSERRSRSERMRDGRRRHGDARAAATRGMEEHVHRTCRSCPSRSSRPSLTGLG